MYEFFPLAAVDGVALSMAVFWISIMLICTIPAVAHYWYKVRQAEADAALKQEMVARGYSAVEILAVVNNKPEALKNADRTHPYEKAHA